MMNHNYCCSCFHEIENMTPYCTYCGKPTRPVAKNERILPPGTVLDGKYLLGECIGEGGFGITYIALDLNLKLKTAIKEYFPASFASRDVRSGDLQIHRISGSGTDYFQKGLKDFSQEANRLSGFAGLRGVVSVLNFFYENGSAYMVMEYIDGISLKEYLEKHHGKLGWKETLTLLQPVITSLIDIHQTGIIHRDISPDNIMMTNQGEMILIDFGSARNVNTSHQNTVLLKRGYAPPEQYQSSGNQGTWTDVYSMCATIYRVISGEKPDEAIAVANGKFKQTSLKSKEHAVPEFLNITLLRGMEPLPENRIHTMAELEECLYKGRKIRKISHLSPDKLIRIGCGLMMCSVLFFGIGWWSVNGSKALSGSGNGDLANTGRSIATNQVSKNAQAQNLSLPGIAENAESNPGNTAVQSETDAMYEAYRDSNASVFTLEEDAGRVNITNTNYGMSEVVIPSSIDGKPVSVIKGVNTNVVSVIIKNGAEEITQGAFKNCVYLETVYIPASVTEISAKAFENCPVLNEIIVSPNNPNYYAEEGHLYQVSGDKIF